MNSSPRASEPFCNHDLKCQQRIEFYCKISVVWRIAHTTVTNLAGNVIILQSFVSRNKLKY